MIRFFNLIIAILITVNVYSQGTNPRSITMDEYQKAKNFTIASLDTDTYVKFENTYILDRYEAKKPIFITGDDGLKKRMDLYKLVAKENMQELGLMVFYTTEKNKIYKALVPNFIADGKVWSQYFEDIHAIDKVEPNFVLKLSYVLSREFAFQQYKNMNGGKEVDEHATYGNDICFTGDQFVNLVNGQSKLLKDILTGDQIISFDTQTQQEKVIVVKELLVHTAKNYAITQLTLIKDQIDGNNIILQSKVVKATPNHPMQTSNGDKKMGEITIGEGVLCLNAETGKMEEFKVLLQKEFTEGMQKIYNIEANAGTTLFLNGVMVKQK
jgi:hypothetical protein